MNLYGSYSSSSFQSAANSAAWVGISLILAIIGGIVLYFTFLGRRNEDKFNGFLGWLYDFLGFKKMLAEALLKITYLIIALYVTLSSFSVIGVNFLGFLLYLVLGNVVTRIIYEFLLIALVNCRNTTEINKKMSKLVSEKKEDTTAMNQEPKE